MIVWKSGLTTLASYSVKDHAGFRGSVRKGNWADWLRVDVGPASYLEGSGSGLDPVLEWDGEAPQCSVGESGRLLEGVDVLDVLVHKDIVKGAVLGDSHVSEMEDREEEYVSDESSYEFERSIRVSLPRLKERNSSPSNKATKGVRKSERHKKPSSRWNEEVGYVASLLDRPRRKSCVMIPLKRRRSSLGSVGCSGASSVVVDLSNNCSLRDDSDKVKYETLHPEGPSPIGCE
ncbi:uncharacterized protein LOC120273647 [Dioscorea cayenensis subsp. rotundata]|uniref:Uncharacterized protein LOC120273647 n=1 Tax=Dioscorea cayennensis subsp. rotundata TaxID=55577 RepID=A0AB40C8S7_DIOCR|nr:uncharacterized protein LOC120273647 [Dioscorea cayenensis subsp. rotundata]